MTGRTRGRNLLPVGVRVEGFRHRVTTPRRCSMGGHVHTRLLAGRYRLEELLGGTDAEVYRAVDEQLGRPVVVKLARSAAPDYKPERFGNEMRTLAGLRHPGLVTLYDAGTEDAIPYLVMQYVPGTT